MSGSSPRPFKIAIPQEALDSLQKRLALTTLPPPELQCDDPWAYGAPSREIARFLNYWQTNYDWRKHESAINEELPQFTLPIPVDGHGTLQAHFVHKKATLRLTKEKPVPLLFLHGWPGNFAEIRKVLPLLTNPKSDDDLVFDVVAPSLPGFGFSEAPKKAGFAHAQYAEVRRFASLKRLRSKDSSLLVRA
jgi:pimeloyl-ACP methyl ester carboxylesterase